MLQQKERTKVDRRDVTNPKASLKETKAGKATASKFLFPLTHPPKQQHTVNRVKRDDKGVPIPVTNDKGHRVNLCWWYQSQYNGDYKCPRKQPECRYIHAKCKDRNEFASIPIPRGDSPAPVGQRANPKAKPEAKPKAKATAKAKTRAGSPAPKVKP